MISILRYKGYVITRNCDALKFGHEPPAHCTV